MTKFIVIGFNNQNVKVLRFETNCLKAAKKVGRASLSPGAKIEWMGDYHLISRKDGTGYVEIWPQ